MDSKEVSSILVIAAHPDDIDFAAAGSVATWTEAGLAVTYLIVTDGDAGGSDRSMARSEMAKIRQSEQRAAAAAVGVTDVVFLGYPDGRLTASFELRRDISRVIRQVLPDRVVCPSPERNFKRIFASHPDHLAAGEASMCAVYPDARNPFAFPELLEEGLEPHSVPEIWIMASSGADVCVDITDVIDRKIAALLSHKSQISDEAGIADRLRGFGTEVAHSQGLEAGRLGEAFLIVEIPV